MMILTGCAKKDSKDHEHSIIKVLFDKFIDDHLKIIAFTPKISPPIPDSNVNLDSLYMLLEKERSIRKDTNKIIEKYIKENGRFVVAVIPYQTSDSIEKEKLFIQKCNTKFISKESSKESVKDMKKNNINLTKIKDNKSAVILPYQDFYKETPRKGFDKYDIVMSFSNIIFNKNETKAFIIVGMSFDKLSGFSSLVYLEKEFGIWKVKCEKGLSIS